MLHSVHLDQEEMLRYLLEECELSGTLRVSPRVFTTNNNIFCGSPMLMPSSVRLSRPQYLLRSQYYYPDQIGLICVSCWKVHERAMKPLSLRCIVSITLHYTL